MALSSMAGQVWPVAPKEAMCDHVSVGLAETLIVLMDRDDVSQADLARTFETSPRQIRRWQSGETEPEWKNALRLADLFGVTLDQLAGREPLATHRSLHVGPGVEGSPLSDVDEDRLVEEMRRAGDERMRLEEQRMQGQQRPRRRAG